MPPPGESAVLTTILNTMSNKEKEYKNGIVENTAICKTTAERLLIGGDIEEILLKSNKDANGNDIMPEEEIRSFLDEQRERIKAVAVKNAERERVIDTFLGAINKLKQTPAPEGSNYEDLIKELMEEESTRLGETQPDIQQHKFVQEVKERLGEKVESGQGGGDDDIELVRNNNSNNVASFKCPFTTMWMENAVINTVCGHNYSREGIQQHISNFRGRGGCKCPYAGCTNHNVTLDQIEDDLDMRRRVKSRKRREEKEREQQAMSQVQMDDDDEEEEM